MALIKAVVPCAISGVVLLRLNRFYDHRGHYTPLFAVNELARVKALRRYKFNIVAAGESQSRPNVVRGFHIAKRYHKYIHLTYGKAWAAIMDCRPRSKTFGLIVQIWLDRNYVLIVPAGCGNGFQACTKVRYLYLTTGMWTPSAERGVSYKEFSWPRPPIVSKRDRDYKPFRIEFAREIKARRRRSGPVYPRLPGQGRYQTVWV